MEMCCNDGNSGDQDSDWRLQNGDNCAASGLLRVHRHAEECVFVVCHHHHHPPRSLTRDGVRKAEGDGQRRMCLHVGCLAIE